MIVSSVVAILLAGALLALMGRLSRQTGGSHAGSEEGREASGWRADGGPSSTRPLPPPILHLLERVLLGPGMRGW